MRKAGGSNSEGRSDATDIPISPLSSAFTCFNEDMPSTSDSGSNTPKHLFDLSDDVIVNILRTLPEEDAHRAAKASWRLHMLVMLHAPGSHLRIDARVTHENARDLLRRTPQLKSLELRYRADTDMLLSETAQNCPELKTLTLVGCRGDVSSKYLMRLPLMEVARKCRELRVLYLRSTAVRSIGAVKTWCSNRGPGSPTLIIRLDDLKPKQIQQLQRLQDTPSPESDFKMQPCLLRISNRKLHLCVETSSPSPNLMTATESTVSTLTAEESDVIEIEQPPTFASDIPLQPSSITESWFTSGFIGNITESPPPDYLESTSFSDSDFIGDPTTLR